MVKVWDFMPDFLMALRAQLEEDDVRWGDTWLKRLPDGQEERTEEVFNGYFAGWRDKGIPVPWLKVAGGALICWIRDEHPEMWRGVLVGEAN